MFTKKKICDVQSSKPSNGRYQDSTFDHSTHTNALSKCNSCMQHTSKSLKTLSLISFLKKYSCSLPIRVCVIEGYSGINDRLEISSGDIFDFHFLKTEVVISIRDKAGKMYHVPLTSPVKFGILYNPFNNIQRAKMGHTFTTVSDIIEFGTPPHIIRATTNYFGDERCNSVFANELLIVKTVGFGAARNVHYINAYSLLLKREKTLYGECSGNFVTDPIGTALSPSDILQFFSHVLPHKAMIVVNVDVTDESILQLASEIITLHGTVTEYSVISTAVEINDHTAMSDESPMALSIPNDFKIKVAAVKDQPEDGELFQKTRYIFESFNILRVKDIRRPYCLSTRSTQLHFYEEIGFRQRSQSIELEKPERVYARLNHSKTLPLPSPYTVPISLKSKCSAGLHSEHTTNLAPHPQSPSSPVESRTQPLKPTSMPTIYTENLEQKCNFIEQKTKGQTNQPPTLMPSVPYTITDERDNKRVKFNISELRRLNHDQVLDLLERIGLSQHRERFIEERIDGEILSECDIEVLQFELGITNKDQQDKLMNIILGVDVVNMNS